MHLLASSSPPPSTVDGGNCSRRKRERVETVVTVTAAITIEWRRLGDDKSENGNISRRSRHSFGVNLAFVAKPTKKYALKSGDG